MKMSLQVKMLLPTLLTGIAFVVLAWWLLNSLQQQNTEITGINTGRALANQVRALRGFYTKNVVNRAKAGGLEMHHDLEANPGALPLPATFVKALGERIAADKGGNIRLYSKHPFPHRVGSADATLDAFEEKAYAELARNTAEPYFEVTDYKGRLSVRYAVSDTMTQECVGCHNTRPDTPKGDWRVGDMRGVIEVIVPIDRAEAGVMKSIASIVVLFLLAIVVSTFLSRRWLAPLENMNHVFSEVAGGNLAIFAKATTQDEIGQLATGLNKMVGRLRRILSNVRDAALSLGASAEEILAASQEQEQGAVEQASTFEEITRTAGGNADAARAIANNADEMRSYAEDMLTSAELGRDQVGITLVTMQDIVENNNQISERVNELYEHSQGIIRVVDIIDSISDRLDLLALNAALEGSRAGEVGKGFSLVAQEMRRLAENVTESTKEIKSTVKEIHSFTQATREASDTGNDTATNGADAVQKLAQFIDEIVRHAQSTASNTRQITASTQQQLSSNEQVVSALDELTEVSRQSQKASAGVSNAVMDINAQVNQFAEIVSTFKVTDDK